MSTSTSRSRLSVAAALIVSLSLGPLLAIPARAAEDKTGIIRGFVYRSDEMSKLAGAKVTAINVRTGKHYASNVTGENGAYQITGLPAGTYDVAIEASTGGVFVTDNLVELAEGQRVALSFSLQPQMASVRRIPGMEEPAGTATAMSVFKGTGVRTTMTPQEFWRSPGGITLMSILGAGGGVVVYNALDSDDDQGSPSSP